MWLTGTIRDTALPAQWQHEFQVGLGVVEQNVAFTFLQRRKRCEYCGSPKKLNTNLQRPGEEGFIVNPSSRRELWLKWHRTYQTGHFGGRNQCKYHGPKNFFQQIHKTETHPLRRKCHVFESGLMLGQTWWQRAFENCREKPPFHWASLPARHSQCSFQTHRPALTPSPGSTESPLWASANTQFLSCPQGPSSLLSGQSLFPFRMSAKPDEFESPGFVVPTDLSQALGSDLNVILWWNFLPSQH